MGVAIFAVLGGALAGLLGAELAGRQHKKLGFAAAGAGGGALGLMLYAAIRATVNQPVVFFWNGLAWSLAGVLFAITALLIIQGFKDH